MLKDITLGQYFPGTSPLHRMDPRTKLLALVLYIVTIFICDSLIPFVLCALGLLAAIRISRRCAAIVYQNIVFAIAIKLLSLVLVALGAGGMGLAIFADVGVMVLAVLNATRALAKD